MAGTLYVVSTPIGNLGDFSPRAQEVLSQVDFIAAEDTRVGAKLLNKFGIKKPQISYFEHNRKAKGQLIAQRILAGEDCALITDAGTPAISDPGCDLVDICLGEGIQVVAVPGPCALIAALSIAGMDCGRFCFEGFLSVNKKSRREHLDSLKSERRTMIFYEAPHRLTKTLDELFAALGDRKIALCRELTKINEEVIRTTLSGAVEYYKAATPKGEFVLIIEGAPKEEENSLAKTLTIEEHVAHYISQGMTKNDAIKAAAHDRGVGKSEIYNKIMRKD